MDLSEIKAALAAATPGKWVERWDGTLGRAAAIVSDDGYGHICIPKRDADANLIASAPAWLAALCAEVERLELELSNGNRCDVRHRCRADKAESDAWRHEQDAERLRAENTRLRTWLLKIGNYGGPLAPVTRMVKACLSGFEVNEGSNDEQ